MQAIHFLGVREGRPKSHIKSKLENYYFQGARPRPNQGIVPTSLVEDLLTTDQLDFSTAMNQ